MKQIAHIALGIALYGAMTACGQEELQGVFSNQAEGFNLLTFMVHESGCAYFHAAVAGVIGKWSHDKTSAVLTFDSFDPGPNKDSAIRFKFDPAKRTYTLAGDGTEPRTDSAPTLHYLTNAIPDRLIQMFKIYPEELERRRRQIQAREEQKREYEEKLAREQPEYDRRRHSIAENPAVVLSQDFYDRADTPATRALKSALGDPEIEFPQDVLVGLLEQLPPDNHWIREQVFARPELSAKTIVKFYPRALEWGAHLNYGILANLANHPHTPRELVEDLASRGELPIGATHPAQRQMVQYAKEVLAGRSNPSAETVSHLYEFAIRVAGPGHADNGKTIILELAKCSATPTHILAKIAEMDDPLVQKAILSNTNTPLRTINQLATSRFPTVRTDVASHPNVPVDILRALSKDPEGSVRAAVAAHPSTPVATLAEMRADEYFDVRRNLIRNPNTPISVLEKLAADKYDLIKSEAQKTLGKRIMRNSPVDGAR